MSIPKSFFNKSINVFSKLFVALCSTDLEHTFLSLCIKKDGILSVPTYKLVS